MIFRLSNGKTAYLRSLHQWPTYAGVLEGFPSVKLNEMILANALKEAEHHTFCKHTYLIPPKRVKGDPDSPMGGEETLPGTTCILALRSHIAGQGHEELALVWHQENFALPFDSDLPTAIEAIDWNQHCGFVSYDDY